MKLELLNWNKKRNTLKFMLKDSTDAFANVLRRFAVDEVPTLAVEDVEFKDNSSALYDEIIAHRLGLIPIHTDISSYNAMEGCTCGGGGCAKCQLKITLKSAKKGSVTAGEAKSQDPKCTFVYEAMPIVKLSAHQKLEFEATATLGTGKKHAKWSPCHMYYSHEVQVKSDNIKLNDDVKLKLAQVCGKAAAVDGKVKINKEELLLSSSYDACVTTLRDAGAEVVETGNHIMTIESWGQLDCKEILDVAADIIIKQLDALEQQFT